LESQPRTGAACAGSGRDGRPAPPPV